MAAPCAPWQCVRGPVRNGGRARPLNLIVSRHMNSAIEFHDSTVADIRAVAGALHLDLPSAYVHRSIGQPGIDSGTVFLQPAEVVFSNATHKEAGGPCGGSISDASISVNGREFANMVPLPFTAQGTVSASFIFTSGGVLSVNGTGVSCQVSGEAVLVEAYDG